MSEKGKHVIHVGTMRVRNRATGATGEAGTHRPLTQAEAAAEERGGVTFGERLLRDCALCTALMLCVLSLSNVDQPVAAMTAQRLSQVATTDFESDEILGRLQFVHNLLPESVQVFWSDPAPSGSISAPCSAEVVHVWNETEPWLEYAWNQEVLACEDGEVMSVTPMDDGTYTLRIRHQEELETIYAQLSTCAVQEGDVLTSGQMVGKAGGQLLFEARRQGKTINPTELMRTP